jgi:hypothetical protein
MGTPNTILLLQGDAEARLLADAEVAIQALFPGTDATLLSAWMTRPDWLGADAPGAPASLVANGLLPASDARMLLAQPHRLVILPVLPAVATPALRHRDGGQFLAHATLRAGWSAAQQAQVAAECSELPPLDADAAIAAIEPLVVRLLDGATAVAVCNAFRRVREPLACQRGEGRLPLREQVRALNLGLARLSQRTGCYVFDIDRPLAQEGGAPLDADCFGGEGRAAELALDEFAALLLDALPDGFAPLEES